MKRQIFSPVIILSIILAVLIMLPILLAQPAVPDIRVINETTGLPKGLDFQTEQNVTYLKQELTRIVQGIPVIGHVFYYTDVFFSYFNPIWKLILGVEFAWSLEFFFALGILIALAFILYFPIKEMINMNPVLSLLTSLVIASLVGTTKIIAHFVSNIMATLSNIWILSLALLIAVIVVIWAYSFMKSLQAEAAAEKLQRSIETLHAEAEPYKRERGL
jgi:hypothetical protein